MELLHGQSLAEVLAACTRLPLSDVAVLVEQLVDALSAAHQIGVVHRDVKPANLFAKRRADGAWHVALLDFGLCQTATSPQQGLTAVGALVGTPGYMAPEQARGASVDARADQYALACVVAELLTGRPAFDGRTREEVLRRQLRGARSHHLERAGFAEPVSAVLDRAMAVAPEDRYRDVRAFGAAFAAAATQVERVPAPVGPVSVKRSGWGRGYALGVVTTVACAAAIVVAARSSGSRPPARVESPPATADAPPRPAVVPRQPVPTPSEAQLGSPEPPTATAPPLDEAAEPVEPVEAVESTTAPKPRRAAQRRRTRASAAVEPPPPEPRALPDGIRDPFATD